MTSLYLQSLINTVVNLHLFATRKNCKRHSEGDTHVVASEKEEEQQPDCGDKERKGKEIKEKVTS